MEHFGTCWSYIDEAMHVLDDEMISLLLFGYFPRLQSPCDGVVVGQRAPSERQWSALHSNIPSTKCLQEGREIKPSFYAEC